jgi:enoyl-CoA hydratase
MEYEDILYDVRDHVATITLNRPHKLNSWTDRLLNEWRHAMDQAEANDDVRVLVLTGAGTKAFSTGFDISPEAGREGGSQAGRSAEEARISMQRSIELAIRIWDFPKPTVAAIAGYCLAGAAEVVQMCDILIAAENAVFGEPEIRHHSGPVVFSTPWVVGIHKAKELLLTGDSVNAEQALSLGLVNYVVPVEKLGGEAKRIADRLALVPPLAQRLNKMAINRIWELMGLRHSLDYAAALVAIIHATDVPEWERFRQIQREGGFRAFLEARDGPFRENAARAYNAESRD